MPDNDGRKLGNEVGANEGLDEVLGCCEVEGDHDGPLEGSTDGATEKEGDNEGELEIVGLIDTVGMGVGRPEGEDDGFIEFDGSKLGCIDGIALGKLEALTIWSSVPDSSGIKIGGVSPVIGIVNCSPKFPSETATNSRST